MFSKITSALLSVITFILSLFGIDLVKEDPTPAEMPQQNVYYEEDCVIVENIAYGEDPQQTFDMYIPNEVSSETSLYFHIHGGAWIMGDKSNGAELAKNAAKKYKLIGVTIDYRLLKERDHTLDCSTMLDDIYNAMKKVKEFCLEKDITLKKALVRGDSAGGHLALMYAYVYKDTSPVKVGLVESNCGPTDMTDRGYLQKGWSISRKDMMMLYGLLIGEDVCSLNYYTKRIQEKLYAVSPCCYVASDVPATIFSSSGKDTLVPVSNGDKLDAMLTDVGVDHYYTCFDFGGHCCRDELDKEKSDIYDKKFDEMLAQYVL